jgi:hypothetical protein
LSQYQACFQLGKNSVARRRHRHALGHDVPVHAVSLFFHAPPSRLPNHLLANEHIVLQGDVSGNVADGMAQAPVFVVNDDQDVDIRPWPAVTASLGPEKHSLKNAPGELSLKKINELRDSRLFIGLQVLVHRQPSS